MSKRIYIDDDWGFTEQFSMALTEANYAGESLKQVRLPHSCKETPLHYFDESIYQMVSGYRKILKAPKNWKGKRIRLTFDGVAHACKVYLNGEEIGSHACGYTAFSVELTGKLNLGEENVLAVEVDSRESLNVPPFGFVIDYMTFGGIYRDVYLDVFNEAFLEDVFVSTVQMTGRRVRSRIKINAGMLQPDGDGFLIRQSMKRKAKVQSENANAENEFVPICEKVVPTQNEEKNEKRAVRFGDGEGIFCALDADVSANEALGEIELWELDNPVLYVLKTELLLGDKVLDEREDTFGFRAAKFFRDGFYLNGKKVLLRGLNRHQSYPYVGYAAPKSLQVNDADILKYELGVNAVRTSHYPQSQYFLDRCDELGLLVFTEFPGWQHIGDEAWKEQALRNLQDLILQYRNHPSIILWGVRINESVDDDEFYKKTNELAHQLDPSRQTGGVRCFKKSHLFEDVYTYNDFVHEGNNKSCEPKKNVTPDMSKAYLISEFNGHMFPTKAYDCEDKRVEHALRHANVLEAVAEQSDIAGCFGWCMFDYNTHKDFGSGDRICYHGVLDPFRNPKLAAAIYASQQEEWPVLVPSSSMDIGEHPGCNRGKIYLFTNADSVKMYKNGEFIHEYHKEDSPYQHMAHGPLVVDDFVGDVLETKEGMKPARAKEIKRLLNLVACQGLNNLPVEAKLSAAKLFALGQINMDQATELYNKYVGDWGGTSTAYRFDAIKNGEVVASVEKQPMRGMKLSAKADHTELREDQTYDMAAIRIKLQDEYGNLLCFSNDPVELSVQGEIELVGPSLVSFNGGRTGTYVRTKKKSGKGKLTIKALGCEPIEISFTVKA